MVPSSGVVWPAVVGLPGDSATALLLPRRLLLSSTRCDPDELMFVCFKETPLLDLNKDDNVCEIIRGADPDPDLWIRICGSGFVY